MLDRMNTRRLCRHDALTTTRRRLVTTLSALAMLVAFNGCDSLVSLTTSLGGSDAGGRGRVLVLFMNNTPYRAVFTTGMFDPADETTVPMIAQFVLDETDGPVLPPQSMSEIGSFTCARTLSLGSERLLELVDANAPEVEIDPVAGVAGIGFFEEGEDADVEPVSAGRIPSFDVRLGVDFPCGALLIFRFEINDVGEEPVRVDFQLIPSSSPR